VEGAAKLVARDITCRFDDTLALQEATLEVRAGEFVSIVGPSGCGKSTLFNAISGLLVPTSGRVEIDGRDVTGTTGHVGYMLQKDLLVPWRTVVGNIVLGAALTRGASARDEAQARALGERYGLSGFLDHYPHALSGGMRQRVALMRTLAVHRDVLLLDEPFGALDSQTRLSMQRWLLEVWDELDRTVLFVTHDVDEAIFLADRVLVMTPRPGRIATEIPVPIPRPRRLETLTAPAFMDVKREILGFLYGQEVA
jgi:ABC-type nitrate/sulfonate/bicarbonate transport system ATPase subunit